MEGITLGTPIALLVEEGESADAPAAAAAAPAPAAAAAAPAAAAPAPAAAKAPVEVVSKASPDWPEGTAMKTMTVREALPELDQRFIDQLTRVYDTGEPYIGRRIPVGLQRGGSGGRPPLGEDEDDPLDEIVSRVNAGRDRTVHSFKSPFSDRNLSVNTTSNNIVPSTGFSSVFTPSRGGTRSFTTPGSARGRSSAGLTEDRLEHVLTKYLESQEQM